MRAVAASEHSHPRVTYLDGCGERNPLPDASCDLALLSNVVHHLEDRAACASELRRVVRPGGVVLVRGILRDSEPPPFLEFFPSAAAIVADQIPSASEVSAMFAAGFEQLTHEVVEQETAPGLHEYHERIKLRAISTLELISDDEFNDGIERLRETAEHESSPRPVTEHVDLLVFSRCA